MSAPLAAMPFSESSRTLPSRCRFKDMQSHLLLQLPLHSVDGRSVRVSRVLRIRFRAKDGGERAGTRQRAQKQQLKHLALTAYRLRFTKALEAELAAEMEEMKGRLKCWSKKRLEDEGYALFNLSVRIDGHLFRDQILRFSHSFGNGILPSHHQFSQGDIVSISRGNPLHEEEDAIEGVLLERAQRFLRVAVQKNVSKNISLKTKWRLDLSANSVAHERCKLAVDYFASPAVQNRVAQETEKAGRLNIPGVMFVCNEAASAVRGLVLGLGELRSRDTGQQEDLTSQEIHVANGLPNRVSGKRLGSFKGLFRNELRLDLNASQTAAIEAALCRKVTLWQGPPGTGKTRTLIQFIVTHCKTGQGKVLACADSNVAVDNLLEGLLAEGLRVLRIGQPVKVKEKLRGATVEAQISVHPLMKKSVELRKSAVLQKQQLKKMSNQMKISCSKGADSMWQKAIDLETQAIQDVISRAEVIAATCIGAGDPILDGQRFTACVIDEASQATEPASLLPLLRSGADSFVLVGDPAQLPPTVHSKEALEGGLGISLFEHLQGCGLTPFLLDTQYRMHPALAQFPSRTFYNGRLLSHPLPSDRKAPKGYDWPNVEKPIVFVNCSDGKEVMLQDSSWQNELQALQVVRIVKQLISSDDIEGGCAGIGVITPYNAQVRLLHDLFLAEEEDCTKLEIKSVDGFQGREKELIILCTVRSNPGALLGFVADRRRMNVALTRARRGLVVVGNYRTLQSNSCWAKWLKEIQEQNLFVQSS